jgi:hypothetical protein
MSKQHQPVPDETPDVSHILNPDVAHERSDVDVGLLFKFIGGLLVATVVILFVIKLLSDYFERREAALEWPPASRVNPPGTRVLPPEPRLQGAVGSKGLPLDEMKKFRAEEDAALNSYGWVDKSAGVVRIPIQQAMKLIAERGLPVKTEAANTEAATGGAAPPVAPSLPVTPEAIRK